MPITQMSGPSIQMESKKNAHQIPSVRNEARPIRPRASSTIQSAPLMVIRENQRFEKFVIIRLRSPTSIDPPWSTPNDRERTRIAKLRPHTAFSVSPIHCFV